MLVMAITMGEYVFDNDGIGFLSKGKELDRMVD